MCKWCVTASVQYLHYRPWNDLIIQIHSNHTRGVKQRRAKNHRAQRTFWISVCGYQPAAGCTVCVAEDSTNLSNDFIQTFQVLSGSFRPSSSQLRRIKSPLVQTLFFNYHKKNISSLLYSLLLTSFGFLPRTLKWSEQSRTETKSVSCNLPKFWRGDLGWSILRLESFCDQMQQRKKMKQGLKNIQQTLQAAVQWHKEEANTSSQLLQVQCVELRDTQREDWDFLLHKETTKLKSTELDSMSSDTIAKNLTLHFKCMFNK